MKFLVSSIMAVSTKGDPMRLLILIACAISLAGCNTTGSNQMAGVNYCKTKTPVGVNPKHVVRDQNGCVLGVDPDPRVRSDILRNRGERDAGE